MTQTMTRTKAGTSRSTALAAVVRGQAAMVGVSQGALAKLMGRSQQSISDRFTGRVPWTVDETERLEEIFGLEPGALLVAAVTREDAIISVMRVGVSVARSALGLAA